MMGTTQDPADLLGIVRAMPAAERTGALTALDAITRPLSVREVERALRRSGVSKSRAVKLATALRGITIIAVAGDA